MVLIEKSLKWSAIGLVGLMVAGSVASAVFAGLLGLLADPLVLVLGFVGFVGFAALLALPALGLGIWLWRSARMSAIELKRADQFIAPDEHGRLPVPTSLLSQPEFAHRAIDAHQASFMSGLTTFNYQPAHTQTITGADGQTLTAAATSGAAPGTFWQLYQDGKLPAKGFLMGYSLDEDGEEVTADWKELYSSLVNGKSGSGKSTLIRSILAQSALQGGKFVVVDPHYGAGEESLGASLLPLRKLMLCDVAAEENQIVDALNYVAAIGQRRLKGQDKERWPLVLVVDETTALLQRSKAASALGDVLRQISQETRKVGVYAMCLGQNFDGRIMDTTIRNSFVSMISLPSRRDVARTMSGNTEFGRIAETLIRGQCVWMAPSGEVHRLAVPNCTAADLELVARSFTAKSAHGRENGLLPEVEATSHPTSKATSQATSPIVWAVGSEVGSEVGLDPRAERVRSLILQGLSQNEIIKEVWGASAGKGYQEASIEFRSLLAVLVKG